MLKIQSKVHALSLFIVFIFTSQTSCVTTKQEGDLLRTDIAQLHIRMKQVDQKQEAALNKDAEKLRALEAKLNFLEKRQKIMMQNSADGGVRVSKIISEMQFLQGELEEARHALGETKKSVLDTNRTVETLMAQSASRLDMVASSQNSVSTHIDKKEKNLEIKKIDKVKTIKYPQEKKALYDFSYAFYKGKKYHEAIDAMRYFIEKYPKDTTLVDNAYYWKGDAYFQLAKIEKKKKNNKQAQSYFKKALLAYQEVMRMSNSDKEDGALYKSGQIFEALGFKEAPVFYKELIKNHKKSPLVHKAKKRLKALKK